MEVITGNRSVFTTHMPILRRRKRGSGCFLRFLDGLLRFILCIILPHIPKEHFLKARIPEHKQVDQGKTMHFTPRCNCADYYQQVGPLLRKCIRKRWFVEIPASYLKTPYNISVSFQIPVHNFLQKLLSICSGCCINKQARIDISSCFLQ